MAGSRSYDPISAELLFSSEVVLGAPYFKSPPTDLRRRRPSYFTHRRKQDVDFSIGGAINNHRRQRRGVEQSLPGKLHLAPLGRFSRADFVICKRKRAFNTQDNVFIGLLPVCTIWALGALINEAVLNTHLRRCVSMCAKLPAELHRHVWSKESVCFVGAGAAR